MIAAVDRVQSGDVPPDPTVTSASLGWVYSDGSMYNAPSGGNPEGDQMEVEIFDAYSNEVVSLSTYAAGSHPPAHRAVPRAYNSLDAS